MVRAHRAYVMAMCAVIGGAVRPCAGVFGVRAAPILLENLLALARHSPLQTYRPQGQWLSIMDLGNGTGLALRGQSRLAGLPMIHKICG